MECTPSKLISGPTGSVLQTEHVEFHLRLTSDSPETEKVMQYTVPAAVSYCENEVSGRRQFCTATYEISVDDWWDGLLPLPLPPLQSVTSIKYLDTAGEEQTLDAEDYVVRTSRRQRGTVELVALQMPFLYQYNSFPITIRFVCGYGSSDLAIPAVIKQAILLVVGWMFRDREPTKVELDTVKRLLNSESFGWY